jgi:DNA-binding LytR/AlgR family response regulator
VVITTAYDNYAVKAFRTNCTDYLLKPIVDSDFVAAWERCMERIEQSATPNMEALMDAISKVGGRDKEYKKRFIVKAGEKIIIIPVEDIAYCYSEEKSTYAVNFAGTPRLLDYSLDMVQDMLDPKRFFRVSRSCIVSINAIENISKHLGTRLKLQLNPRTEEDVVVSRSRTSDFLVWLDSN